MGVELFRGCIARDPGERERRNRTTPEVAVGEARTALASFQRLGARRDADAAAALLRTWASAPPHPDARRTGRVA